MLNAFRQLVDSAIDQIFPTQCVACSNYGNALCPACAQQAEPVPSPICLACGRPEKQQIATCATCCQFASSFDEASLEFSRSATFFTSPIREAVHGLKYESRIDLAAPMARYLFAAFRGYPWTDVYALIDVVVPVPLHPQRLAKRGYNQAELLAEQFCRYVDIPCSPMLLQRHHNTDTQVGKNIAQRQQNVGEAFRAPTRLPGLVILLIDDVYTTGATLHACAAALKRAGAAQVYGLALATPKQ